MDRPGRMPAQLVHLLKRPRELSAGEILFSQTLTELTNYIRARVPDMGDHELFADGATAARAAMNQCTYLSAYYARLAEEFKARI